MSGTIPTGEAAAAFDWLDLPPTIDVAEDEYKRLLGFPADHEPGGRARELCGQARAWYARNGAPWVCSRYAGPLELTDSGVRIRGTAFGSPRLREMLAAAEAETGVLVLVSAGAGCEEHSARLWTEEKPDEYLFLEMFGSAVAEHLVTLAAARLCAAADRVGLAVLPHYSPGYTGWNVADQVRLFSLLQGSPPLPLPEPVRVLDSGMLQPKKSLLAFFGLTRNVRKAREHAALTPCENCAFPNCGYRRTPYRFSRRMMPGAGDLQPPPPSPAPPKYSVNARALQKWSAERLKLEPQADGSILAGFTYDGTTCSNMGLPLRFMYDVRLGPRTAGFPILSLRCAPASGETNHEMMCAWKKDPAGLAAAIQQPPPLAGQPLAQALRWERVNNPAGCFCESSARDHKWGLVFEVIHFALHAEAPGGKD